MRPRRDRNGSLTFQVPGRRHHAMRPARTHSSVRPVSRPRILSFSVRRSKSAPTWGPQQALDLRAPGGRSHTGSRGFRPAGPDRVCTSLSTRMRDHVGEQSPGGLNTAPSPSCVHARPRPRPLRGQRPLPGQGVRAEARQQGTNGVLIPIQTASLCGSSRGRDSSPECLSNWGC